MGTVAKIEKEDDPEENARLERIKTMPSLAACYNLMDFESVARRIMKKSAWAYYSSGADDEIVSHAISWQGTWTNWEIVDTQRKPHCLSQDLVSPSRPC